MLRQRGGGRLPEVLEEKLPTQRLLGAKEEREQGEAATFSVVAGPAPHSSELSGDQAVLEWRCLQ